MDIGAKVEIYRLIGELVAGGAAVLLVSSDLDELAGIDRILVFYRGGIVKELAAAEASSDSLLAWSTGAAEAV